MDLSKELITGLIKDKAREAGFELCGITSVSVLTENGYILKEWCDSGMHAGMEYMARNSDKRINPDLILPGVKSIIVFGINYYSEKKQGGGEVPVISRYAYGKDYHEVIIEKLNGIIEYIGGLNSAAVCKAFTDSATVFEKPLATRAGIGWQGKHSILVNRKIGSFFFLGEILTTLELCYDQPSEDHCGTCKKCIETCPTKAINSNRTIDARKCIAYLTIDNKLPVKAEDIEKLEGRIVGCDICQEVCPWNTHATHHCHPEFEISEELRTMTSEDWLNLSKEDHARLFRHSAISRRKYEVFIENVTNVTNSLRGKVTQ